MKMMTMMMRNDDGNDNKISLFTPDIVLAHRLVRSSFSRGALIKECSLYQGVSYIGVLITGIFFSPFFDEVLLIPGCSLSRCPLY